MGTLLLNAGTTSLWVHIWFKPKGSIGFGNPGYKSVICRLLSPDDHEWRSTVLPKSDVLWPIPNHNFQLKQLPERIIWWPKLVILQANKSGLLTDVCILTLTLNTKLTHLTRQKQFTNFSFVRDRSYGPISVTFVAISLTKLA